MKKPKSDLNYTITWTAPSPPNGRISGYTVVLTVSESWIIVCGCGSLSSSYFMTEVSLFGCLTRSICGHGVFGAFRFRNARERQRGARSSGELSIALNRHPPVSSSSSWISQVRGGLPHITVALEE